MFIRPARNPFQGGEVFLWKLECDISSDIIKCVLRSSEGAGGGEVYCQYSVMNGVLSVLLINKFHVFLLGKSMIH